MKEKIITAIVSVSLLFSAIVIEAGATPGVDEWGISTDDLSYDKDAYVDVEINTSTLKENTDYKVLYPIYSGIPYGLSWGIVMAGGAPVKLEVGTVTNTSTEHFTSDIILNVSGIWALIEDTYDPRDLDGTNFDELGGYFWVNATQEYAITLSDDKATYGINKSIDIVVTEEESSVACWIDVIRVSEKGEKTKIVHRFESDGAYTMDTSWLDSLEWAGKYIVQAYRDVDDQTEHGYMEEPGYYSDTYGSIDDMSGAINYYYETCGPWDPPEWNATSKIITVEKGEPTTSIPEVSQTMYWGFDGEISISVENYDGGYIDDLDVKVYNSDEEEVTDENLTIDNTDVSKGYIHISNKDKVDPINVTGGWGRNKSGNIYGEEGTWYAYLYKDIDEDGIEEWNTTVEFEVDHAPDLQWKWVDDDGCISDDNNDGVIPWVPDFDNQSLEITFQIIGEDHSYYGGEIKDFGENITVSGNALFLPATADEIPGAKHSKGTWTIPLIPTMSLGGGEIIFSVDWEGHGKHTEILNVGGSKNNGTVVSISPSSFVIDKDVELTVTVLDSKGTSFMNAEVSLYWIKNGTLQGKAINHTAGGGDSEGRYTFAFNTSDQTTGQKSVFGNIKAPRDVAAHVKLYYGSPEYIYGYATAEMKAKSDLAVDLSKNTVMAGEKTRLWMNTSIYSGGVTNKTYPNEGEGLQIELYNDAGEIIKLNEDFGSVRNEDLRDISNPLNDYFLRPGTYTVYAYNNTHDSTGHNATLVVKAVDITCDKSPFIWKYDEDLTATFTVKYNGLLVDGQIRIYNMTDEGDHYGAWFNTGDKSLTFDVVEGTVTVEGINASNLPGNKARENITFTFRPEKSGSKFAPADGIVPVKIPDVSATPKALPYNEPASLTIKVTGRGEALNDVSVGLEIPGMAEEIKSKTDSKGEALFSFTPLTTGDIKINIENRTSDTTVLVTSWALYIDAPQYVNEKKPFTITIRSGSATAPEVTGATVIFNGKTQVGDYTFTAPSVTTNREYTIDAKKEGYAGDEATILVINVPQLTIVLETEEVTAGEETKFTVCVADDTGRAIIGATVTFNNKGYTTGAQGIAALPVPTEEGDYTITAAKEGFASATVSIEVVPGSPGFEMLMLIAALGIAFILLKRRKR